MVSGGVVRATKFLIFWSRSLDEEAATVGNMSSQMQIQQPSSCSKMEARLPKLRL